MIVSFVYPSSPNRTGGVMMLYQFANALAARGHEVNFLHGPAGPYRVASLRDLPEFAWDPGVRHVLVDSLDDPSVPSGDVVFHSSAPARLGLPCGFVQGYGMLPESWERAAFLMPAPKVCIAEWLVEIGLSHGCPPEQLWHVPYGLDHAVFAQKTPHDQRSVDVAMLSHPHREKGWKTGLAVLEALSARRSDFRAIVFGIDEPRDSLPPGVDLVLGANHRRLVDEVYNQTKIFMQVSSVEGFGLTPVEAMACGAALVTTDNGGSRDYAVPGETAMVAPPEDSDALATAVSSLLEDDPKRILMAKAGQAFVRRFDWARSGELLEAHLTRYLADPGAYQATPSPTR